MKCVECLLIQKAHPGLSARELSPTGSFEATTYVNGTAMCETHAGLTMSLINELNKKIKNL